VLLRYEIKSTGLPGRDVGAVFGSVKEGVICLGRPSLYEGWVTERAGTVPFEALLPGTYRLFMLVRDRLGTVKVLAATLRVSVR
jgi:hypothetical protein